MADVPGNSPKAAMLAAGLNKTTRWEVFFYQEVHGLFLDPSKMPGAVMFDMQAIDGDWVYMTQVGAGGKALAGWFYLPAVPAFWRQV